MYPQKKTTAPPRSLHCDIGVRSAETKPEFSEAGYHVDRELKQKITDSFGRLLEMAPSTASIRARVEKSTEGFKFHLMLSFGEGSMFASEQAVTPRKAMRKVLDNLYLQIHRWRKERTSEDLETTLKVRGAWSFQPRVLIVDDDPVSTKLMESCLKQQGCTTVTVMSGREAVREVTERDYDLLILDWQMPGMDGLQTIRNAQDVITYDSVRLPWLSSSLPVITYSGAEEEKVVDPNCSNFPVVGHIAKTATYSELCRATAAVVNDLRAA